MDDNIKKLHQALIDDGYDDVGTEQEFRDYVSDSKNVATLYNALSEAGYDNFKDQKSLETYLSAKAPVAQKPSTPQSSGQSVSSKEKKQSQYPQEVIDAFNSPDNKPGNFKDLAQLNDEYQRGELKKPSLISQALGMMPKVDAGNIGREQKMGGMITNMLLGDNMQQPQDNNQQVQHSNQEKAPATEQPKPTVKDVDAITGAAPVQQVDAIYNKYVGKGDALSETMYDLMASGQAQNQEEAQSMAMGAMNRAANRLAQRTTDEFVSKLDDSVENIDQAIDGAWYSHAVQDNLKKMAAQLGIQNNVAVDENGNYITRTDGYDQFVNGMVKPAMVESLVKKYGENYRKTAEDLATRLYSHDEHVQDRLMNQDINDALSDVISKYTSTSVAKAIQDAEAASNAQMAKYNEQYKYVDSASPFAIGAISEANKTRDPQKVLGDLQKKFGKLYQNPQFLNDMSNAAFKVMQRYGMNGVLSGDPKQFKPMINAAIKNELDQLEVKGMIPRGSADYILKTGIENTIIGKVSRKIMQTDYQNWLEDIANQQYQPGFWERVGSGALTFAGDAWSYWLPGAAGGKLTKSMIAKAEGKLAGDLMAKGMERKVAERAAKVLIGKSKDVALKNGAVHGAVTFGGQSVISKPIDEKYRTGQFDENGKIYHPSGWKIALDTLLEGGKQSALGVIMQGNTIANMIGKGRGLATNILADVGGKVVDSGIMTGQQMLERMAHDPNFKPTGKDAAESFLESMANLTSIGLPGMVGKYARFKDAKEFNRKFDFNDQDIAELKRFGYDDLRDAFEKLGINGYRADGEGVQMMGQLTDKYMNLMNDKSVPEVLKAKMMAVVEGKRPSSFSPVIDSIIVQPMDNDGKVYLETLNKDGGIIDRKEYSSLEEAQKAEKKLDFEKSLNITSEYEKAYHTDALQDRLNTVYEQARDRYAAGEQLNDEDKAAIYLHQNASAIGDIMQKQQKGMEQTEQEQQMVNSYRHFYDSAFENSPIMKEYVRTFEDSQGVEHGTLRKALEGDGKSRTAEQQKLVEEYQKQLYNDIVLKREMNDAKEQMNQNLIEGQRELPGATQEGGASAQNAEATAEKPVDASVSSDVPPTEPPTPPVGGETPTNVEGTPLMENGASPSDANTASNESKSDAYVMGQNAYQNGDAEGLKAIDHNDDVSKARLKRAFGDDEAQMNVVVKAYEDGKDMEQFVAQRANSMTPAQQDAVRKYVEAQDAKKGVYDALQHADDGYGDALKELLWTYQTEDGNIVPATLTTGQQVFLKKANEYGGGFVVVPDEDGNPAIKQVSSAEIKEVGTPIPLDDYINQQVTEQKNARQQQFFAQYDGSGLKPSDTVEVAMEAGEEPMQMTFAGYSEDGKIVLSDGKDNIALTKDEFNSWRQNALDSSIGAELDAEDVQRANDDAAKAEADKKQRYNEGIVGLGMKQPDYSSKDTEPKVAAEYLQEQFGNDHGKLMNLISGSRSDIKEQLDNKRKAASEYEDWLSLNADLDPEKAQKVENDLALVNEQIADLETRYKNWNAIRKEVMTPEEARTLKNERKAEIEKAGVDDSVGSPSDEREVAVLDNKELKKQYPTMDEASNYIASERKRIYHIQNDEVQPQIDDINEALEQYMNGDIDYSADQLKELNTTKAQLEARQANLSASAKDLKAQDKLLNTLYSAENKEERAKAMEELTPSEQRKVLVADALKKNDLGSIKEIYKDASIDVMDLTPQTLEEAVSESLSPHSLNPESLQYELGKSNFKFGIGKRYDSNKFNYLIAKKGTGMSVNEFAVRVFNDLPVNLQDMGYTDQDVRNTLLDMFKSYDNVKDMRNVALMNRIAAAEEELSAEEEWYEAQKEREIIERQAEIEEYNSYIQDKALSLPTESELNAIEGMEYDRMLEAEEREREYKEYVKSILPEIADYDDRSNEEGYGGGGGLGSDSSRRGVDEGNRQGEEISGREASSQSETGESTDSGRTGRQETGSMEPGEGSVVRGAHLPQEASFGERLKNAIAETEPNPSEAQKKAGNYKKGHLSFGGYDFTVETPKGATRSGKDEQGKPWSVTMHDTYGYILGKIGVDGDHIDMFINDGADLDTFDGNVYVVDQVTPETGEFDEHKVMYGYPSEEAATEAYLANYSKGWKGLGKVTSVPKTTFDKWLESSDRKTKPFADYAMIKKGAHQDFISDMEYTYENDVHPSEEDKPKMQKFAERLLNFHQDREDKPEYGYTMLSSNINGDKLYPSEKKWFGTKKYRQGVSWVDKDNVCAYELNPRFNAQGYLTAVGVHKIVPLASFNRDIKEVKPSEMTEAQKVAFDAVSAMLKKAGIPVRVISNEEMEKVAEEQDNLAISMLMSDPQLRFNIKTPEQKKAAKAAYDWATEHRPDKYAQYAIVNMDNPNQMPEYFEKKSLAEQWRKYYTNAWRIGNYKAFDLNKPFEEQVKNVKGDVPSEFDPYKVDAQNNKRNELKKQIKETEDAYNSTGQERNNYQIQLMKEYMDEHGLASENDIPDDVWSKLNDKAHEKYQDKLDSLFAKYKDLDRQLKAIVQPGVRFLRTYHGTGASFDKFDFSHMGEGEGSQAFGWGGYVTNSKDIAEDYTRRAKIRKDNGGFEFVTDLSANNKDMVRQYIYKHKDVDKGLDAMRKDLSSALEMFPDDEDLKELSNILAKKNEEIAVPDNIAYLYDVDIPDDNGDYIDWENRLKKSHLNKVNKELVRIGKEPIDTIYPSHVDGKVRGQDLYDELSSMLGSKEAASKLLSDAGFVGIKYPAGTIYGGAEKGDYNYVIFDENNANIVGNTKFAQGKGVVYGYTDGKEIVLNQEHLNPNTPIHEYQHLWRTAAKNMNPELIEHGDKLIMQTQLFADLKEDPNYKHLSDDEICDEAFARLTGEDGAAILEQMAKDAIKENPLDTAKELTIINRLKNWLKKFWYWTLDTFTKWKPEDIKKMTLEDIRNLVLRDLANGVDPRNLKSRLAKKDAVEVTPEIANTPVNIVNAEAKHGFKNYAEAREWAKKNIVRTYNNEETGGKGEINISNTAVGKYLSEKAVKKTANKDVHMSVLKVLPSVLRESIDAIQHVDRNKVGNDRSEDFGINPDVMIHRCYGAVNIGGKVYGVKITLKENVRTHEKTKLYSYEATKIELLDGQSGDVAMTSPRNSNNSITVAKIIKGFETTKENGKKFSLEDPKTLAGVHNISEEKLLKAIKQGGLANPSVAVIDTSKQNHDDYGDISLILPSDKVAKKTGKNAGTWQGDAWTPTYPQVERQMSNKGSEKASNDVSSVPSDMYSEVRRGLDRWLDGGEENSAMAYMFLHEKGVAPEPKKMQHKFSDEAYNELKSITAENFNINGIGKADAQKVLDMYIEAKFDGDKDLYEEKTKAWLKRNKSIVDAGANGGMRYAIAKENVELYDEYGFNFKAVQTFVRDVEYDHRKTGVDMNATLNEVEDYIKTNNLTDEFNTWLEGKEKEYGIKEVIFDGFTPSGNRRYVPNTLENVSKIMKKQGRNGATGTSVSFQNFAAKLMPSYGTLKDIRSKKGLLTSDREKFDDFREKWSNVFFELGMKCQPDATGTFDDYGLARLSEAAMTSDPQAYLKKEYNVDFSDEDTKRLKEMVKAIKEEHPAMYFETKFERPVGFDEFSSAVVPTTASNEVKQALQNAGVQIYEYDKEKEGDRNRAFNEAINSNNEIRFHRVTEPEELERLNKEKTFRMYSGMQEVDGKLYSPMAAIIDGKRTDATEIGAWMGADERPDLVKGGKFQLVKTDKTPGAGEGPVRAAYNPYMHTSTSMMNDQFTGAYARGNIKVVEWEIPESEKTSGYRAEGAKDAVGLVPWHSGSVNGLLPKDRQRSVMLSRWRKAVRVVPDSEVAESIAEQLDGTGLAIPWNVVTPNQLRELVKLGVPITTDESGQQAPETKEKFLAQMNELKKEFPQAQFVDVKMTKDAFKEWGSKGIVKSPILEQKLQKHPDSLMKAGTYFSGGGLVEEGLKGIIDPVVAVEYDRKISGVYRNNFGQHIVTADVRDVDPKELVKHIDGEVEYFHASPVCKNYSQAKSNGGEVELDKETAKSTADFIDAVKPRVVTIENVKGYKDSEAMKIITQALDKNGYKWDADVYNAADFGGYTSRERLIVRAVKDGELPEKPKKQPRKGGWLEAVEDILPTLTEKKNGVAPWMDARLKADGIDWQKVEKPLYVMGSAYADGKIPHAYGDEILPTLRTKSGDVIIMPGGKVLRADGRVLARITGLGDDYLLPKTESLAHTIIGNGIPVQLTKGVIAPLLNKDDLSGRNVLARLGSSIFKNTWDADKQKQVSDRVVNTANKLGGAEATVYTSVDEVPDAYLSDVKNGATGWYDPTTHTVHVYLPNCADADEAQRTVFHEKIGHEGMEVLLGGEQGVRKFADFVYKSVDKKTRGKILDFANKYDPGWSNPDRINVGTQEYIAHLAEEGPTTAEDFSLWTKIKHYLIKVLKKLGIRVPGLLNDKDLRYYLMKAGKALHVWDNMPKEKQEAMMAQASNAEIKDALADGAGKGKPRQKKGESTIQYMKRVMEWKRWKEAREDKEDPEPPMFYDFDKDAEGKKEWERLNKEWRDSHGLRGEEMPLRPERKEGESDDAFMNRYKEWEKWNDAMGDTENPMPDMFSFEKQKQDEARQKYEDWLTRHELNEQNDADLDLYEGKIYPAETNPKADALEQRVMQDLAEVTSTDVTKEGAARSVHDAVIYRRKNIESASATDAIFINSVKHELNKMANASYLGRKADAIADVVKETVTGKTPKTQAKRMAEAIPYIIEAPRRMRDIANELNAVGAFENGHIHVTAEDVDAIQPFTEELRDLAANSHKVEKNGKETIVYDDVPSMTEVASKMAKAINENHNGEEGFVPIDGTDFLAEHVLPVVLKRIVPKGIEYKNLSEEMQSLLGKIREWYDKTFTWLKDSHTVRDDIGYTADYVNHRWDKEKSDDKAYADLVEGRQRTKSPNEKLRKVSTYMEGVDAGLVPKTTDITDLLAYYSQSNIEAFANKTFLQELSGINVIERNKDGEIISSMPLLSSIQPKEMMVDENKYTPYVVPGINTVWVYNQGKIFNKSAEDWFNAAFGTVKIPKVLKGVKNAMSIAKTLELGFSGFHAGALTEVYAVQNSAEFGPAKAMAYFMKYLITDTAKTHQLPAFANPEAFKEAAKHLVKFGSTSDYATADIENLYEKVHSYVAKLHSKLVDGNVAMKAGSSVTFPLEVATELLKMSQKGLDVALWSYLHDGLKLATYQLRAERTMERAKKLNWDEDMLNKALDEDGQFVNDMFGGQHFDVLGISKKMQTILDFIFLSKDWLISTTRHALSIFGYGSIWNEASIKNFWEYYKHVLGRGEMTKEDYLRLSRSKSGLLCYGVGFMIGYEGLSQLVNAAMRAWDEEKQKEKADEIRKTNPSYKSPYELAYPDGMHWYDYLMRGNSLGQQSKIFMGRYADGTEMYIRHGKQFREIPELFFDAKDNFAFPGPMVRRMYGKASPLLRSILDANDWFKSPDYADKEMQRKYGENLGLIPKLASYYVPFAVPTQKDKEFKMLDLVFPSSKGFSRYKAQDYFKTFIMSEDKQGLAMTYNACVQNGIDPEEQLKAAISSVKALEASEMQDGVTSLQVASERFDEAKSITEKKKMRQKMKKFLSQSEYKAFTQKEALDMVQSYLNGEDDLKEMEKAENKYLMKAKSEDVTEDWRIQAVWNGTMETYDEYLRLKDVDKAKANAFKNSKTNKRLFAARKAISAARRKMNKAKKQMDGQNDAAKMVEIRKTRKELIETLNGME
jgi:site-specific DNA-cytosine methylase